MAEMAEAGGQPTGGGHKREYLKEHTVIIDVIDNSKVKAKSVLENLVKLVGEDAIYTCVPKAGNAWEITLADSESVNIATGGLKVGESNYECSEVIQQTTVVSFMHLSGYIQDSDIEKKLHEYGVELVSEIKRRFHPDFHIEDGTRYVKCKFPPELKSLPYTMRFYNGDRYEQYRVIHNDQIKLCRECNSDQHIFRDCPNFVCFKCNGQGHVARLCKAAKCSDCGQYGMKCTCEESDSEHESERCEHCEQSVCECTTCDHCEEIPCTCTHNLCKWCDKSAKLCRCKPDDICEHCSVELDSCQCVWCDACEKRDCVCESIVFDNDAWQEPSEANSDNAGNFSVNDAHSTTGGGPSDITDGDVSGSNDQGNKPVTRHRNNGDRTERNSGVPGRDTSVATPVDPNSDDMMSWGATDRFKWQTVLRNRTKLDVNSSDHPIGSHRRKRVITKPNVSASQPNQPAPKSLRRSNPDV